MNKTKLAQTAKKLAARGKGILAADESSGTIEKRFKDINLPSTETNRRNWRELLFTAPGLEKFISGVILFDETIRQKASSGTAFAKLLKRKGVIPGIKVDQKSHSLANFSEEEVTEGLDGLRDRLAEYAKLGAEFTKWRAVITMGKGLPTDEAIGANAHALARYAALSQEAGLVPIVEPEVLMKGTHTIAAHEKASRRTLMIVFDELKKYRIYLPGMLLKTNMAASGLEAKAQASPRLVAQATIRLFRKTVPGSVPGIMFLSGGLSPEQATVNLNAINKFSGRRMPWELSYSYGRALQGEALEIWGGRPKNVAAAQRAFLDRAEKVASAREGQL
ncbi:MAG: Fructose-bisphosphate aldolase [Candidatus Beckwithbacteria bacterium GW2011_GWB1_47_15]|uniref:Probable fructose-bisphosphate aldolase class 1 n=1 Tax=Candidatus Beckwithbacteria bacterium GW2011_GWB1_47_15 TaxID=1618371 RepID=A0A0G1UU52_9BACT|nr:MAG: fructose-bisphosphate aldolase, fructose-bisphosphate aldolase, class I [Candidatus Beckwithbacteria bacterium GW2011_GWC1_49_16]KKU35015.1 MAG: Fructose-bisphosphate aldolase [Candidatus Beckwithbacteria bacterium GW2011_GWA1_46_30]KKU61240.1 MAG: Fructose-bisphosphate aldolase [Candidatus Beckwithbacteria bacterium GW2011_GWB1_47_15]KKU71466.1 MAG: Fructose-bisphosphate aldolase [Candidatus Beckwithbacteria bacterium GW2011_GWA2_47_25]KKW03317.1 MAG: Fructose-bisphosphate aldolase [Ca